MSSSVVVVKMIENSVSIAKNGGGSYIGTRITYEEGGQLRVKGLHPVALQKNEQLAGNLMTLSDVGLPQTVVLTTEKVDGFVNFISLVATNGDTTTASNDTPTTTAPSTSTVSRNFTPRAHVGGNSGNGREEAISKAVALKAAVEFGVGIGVTEVESVIAMSEKFNAYLSGKTGE
jgi:hypothetical protein